MVLGNPIKILIIDEVSMLSQELLGSSFANKMIQSIFGLYVQLYWQRLPFLSCLRIVNLQE
jgi:hypothetical protein